MMRGAALLLCLEVGLASATERVREPLSAGWPVLSAARVDSVIWVDKRVRVAQLLGGFDSRPEDISRPGKQGDFDRGAAREARCEAALGLPWGPIDRCSEAVIAGAVGATAAISLLSWWGQGFEAEFNVADEGWFGPSAYAGGIDKLGHAYSFYLGTRLGTRALGWAGVPPADALRISAGVSFGVGLGIEVLDGLSRSGRYGFSWGDLAMNAVGIGAGMLMESNRELDKRFAFRWLYSPGGSEWYDRQIYLVALRLSGISEIGPNNPLRYIELLAGYGAKGFRSDFDFSAGDTRRRSFYVGIGLNLTELLQRGGARRTRAWPIVKETLRYVQVPGTAVARGWHRQP